MVINLKKSILLLVLWLPIILQQIVAYKLPSFLITFIFLMFFLFIFFSILIKKNKERITFILKSPLTSLSLLFVLLQIITIFTAHNNLALMGTALLLMSYKVLFIIPAFMFNFKLEDFIKYKKIIYITFFILIILVLLNNITEVDKLTSGSYYPGPRSDFFIQPLHSIFPPNNSFAPYLVLYFLIFLLILKNKKLTFISYILALLTSNRVSIVMFSLIYFRSQITLKRIILALITILVVLNVFHSQIERAVVELSFSDKHKVDQVPRLHYMQKSFDVFKDHKYFGIGLKRFSSKYFWEQDNYYWHKTYAINFVFIDEVGWEMDLSTTDTGFIFLAELGIIGTILIILIFIYLLYIGKVVRNKFLKFYIFFGIAYLYNMATPFSSSVFGIPFWFIVGVFMNEYYLLNKKGNKI